VAGTDAPGTDALTDLFGLLAYAELVAFFNLSGDAELASSLADKAALGEMAVAEFGHFRALHDELTKRGAVPEQAMEPFVAPLDAFHARTAPADWLESLVKAYVGDGLADTGHADFVISRVRAAIEADPSLAGRLALWARRLVGEALAQAHRVVAERPSLANLVAGADGETGRQGDIGRMFAHITDAHDQRLAALGL
jgi:hypothetical protein